MILLWKVKNHRAAVYANLGLISLGAFVLGGATILLNYGMLGPKAFYLMNGIGLYIALVPYQVMLLERLLASLHTVATASFLIAPGGFLWLPVHRFPVFVTRFDFSIHGGRDPVAYHAHRCELCGDDGGAYYLSHADLYFRPRLKAKNENGVHLDQ